MSVIEDISSFLVAQGLGVEASTLWLYQWGINASDNGILIMQASGPPPKRFIGDTSTIKESHITILVRNTSIATAITNSNAVYSALDNAVISGYFNCFCDQDGPILVDKEETQTGSGKFRYYFSINLTIMHV